MVKIMFRNEENLLEIIHASRIFIDPDAPTDIIVVSASNYIRLRLRFTDVDEAENFMDIFFTCDKVNLAEIISDNEDNAEIILTVEEEADNDIFGMLDPESLASLYDEMNDEDEEDDDTNE